MKSRSTDTLLFLGLLLTYSMAPALADPESGAQKRTSTAKKNSTAPTVGAKSTTARRKAAPVRSEAEAVAIVNSAPEVRKFVALIKKSGMKGSSSFVEFDRKENGEYIIHVYQYVPDDKESGHTATFNWYHVNEKTGKVSKEF